MEIQDLITQQIKDAINTKYFILNDEGLKAKIAIASEKIIKAYQLGYKTLLAGNGGSAADSQHIAGEFVSKFYFDRPAMPSIALTTDTSILTAIGNDYGYDQLFERQINALGTKGDIFIGISTSGNSINIINALKASKLKGIFTIGLTGITGGSMEELCNICIKVPSTDTPRIQECHIMIGHIICCIVEKTIYGNFNSEK
jgi:D-sedoheptulose 7-phosphate isomerase